MNNGIEFFDAVAEFFMKLAKDPNSVAYGKKDVEEMISRGLVSSVISCDEKSSYKNQTIISDNISRFHELVGLGGVVAFLHYSIK